jgi:hypothetical protein
MKRISITIGVLVVLLLAPLHAAICQELASLRAGEPIRLSVGFPTSQRIEGRLVSLSADTIVLRTPTTPLPIGFSTVSLLEVRRRSGGSFMKSVAFGLLGGVVVGAVVGLTQGNTDPDRGLTGTASEFALIGSVLGGAAGLIGGTVIGACCSSSWEPVPLPQRHASYSTR